MSYVIFRPQPDITAKELADILQAKWGLIYTEWGMIPESMQKHFELVPDEKKNDTKLSLLWKWFK